MWSAEIQNEKPDLKVATNCYQSPNFSNIVHDLTVHKHINRPIQRKMLWTEVCASYDTMYLIFAILSPLCSSPIIRCFFKAMRQKKGLHCTWLLIAWLLEETAKLTEYVQSRKWKRHGLMTPLKDFTITEGSVNRVMLSYFRFIVVANVILYGPTPNILMNIPGLARDQSRNWISFDYKWFVWVWEKIACSYCSFQYIGNQGTLVSRRPTFQEIWDSD